jgi:cold shock CspA family protein
MDIQTTLAFKGIDRSPALEKAISKRVKELAHLRRGLMRVHVVVSELGRHQQQGRHFSVHLDLHCKGRSNDIAITHRHDEDPFVALRDAFDAAKRVLQEDLHRVRGDVKQHAQARRGRVARVDRDGGFGFIEDHDGQEYYFGRDNVANHSFENLQPGQPVSFLEDYGADTPQAKRVNVQRPES